MRFFLKLAYNGASFHGWQTQPNANSVQQTLEEALSTILRTPVSITGAGRTDTGVNARVMFAHFDVDDLCPHSRLKDKRRFLISLNRLCGPDIAVYDLIEVAADAHARFDATKRTYKYFISFEKTPFLSGGCWHSPSALDVDAMNECASLLLDVSDFTSFAKLHSDAKTNICKVSRADWELWHPEFSAGDSEGIVFTISADRFLRNMVRAVVGTLVDVGRGKISKEDFIKIINDRDRCSAGTSMPPQALFLWDVEYPYIPLKTKSPSNK